MSCYSPINHPVLKLSKTTHQDRIAPMENTQNQSPQWTRIQNIWKEYVVEYRLIFIVFFLLIGLWAFGRNGLNLLPDMLGYVTNVFTELLSIVATVLVLDRIYARRQADQELTRLKALLGSNESVVTKIAVAELSARGWLFDGSLSGTSISNSNLQKADMTGVDLSKSQLFLVNLSESTLQSANLHKIEWVFVNLSNSNLKVSHLNEAALVNVNLEKADLTFANLQMADLSGCDLTEARLLGAELIDGKLRGANLSRASLFLANLTGVDLREANLEGVNLRHANINNVKCDENTKLPNGQYWSDEVNWLEFGAVDFKHNDDWRIYIEKNAAGGVFKEFHKLHPSE